MFKTVSKHLGSYEYRISQLPVDDGIDVGVCLLKTIGPALLALVGGESLASLDRAALGDALTKLSPADVKFLCKTFAEKTFVVLPDKKTPRLDHVWDTHFAGRYKTMGQWLVACVELNFPDFLDSSGAATKPASAPTAEAPSS
jgi:hypothetical protein